MIDTDLNRLMSYQLDKNYKALCDKIKIGLLGILIDKAKQVDKKVWHIKELEIIKLGVQEEIDQEKQKELEALTGVINNLIGRFGSEKPQNLNPQTEAKNQDEND